MRTFSELLVEFADAVLAILHSLDPDSAGYLGLSGEYCGLWLPDISDISCFLVSFVVSLFLTSG